MVWRKMGNKVVPLFHAHPADVKVELYLNRPNVVRPINMKKRMTLKKTRAKMGARITRKSKEQRMNPK